MVSAVSDGRGRAARPRGSYPWSRASNARPSRAWWWTVDRLMLAALLALMLGGIVLSLAASPPVASRLGLEPFYFVSRHVLYLIPALVVLLATSFLPFRYIRRIALVVFVASIVLVAATLAVRRRGQGRAALDRRSSASICSRRNSSSRPS